MKCFRCQRPLTDIRSKAIGYGKTCWQIVKRRDQPELPMKLPHEKKGK